MTMESLKFQRLEMVVESFLSQMLLLIYRIILQSLLTLLLELIGVTGLLMGVSQS